VHSEKKGRVALAALEAQENVRLIMEWAQGLDLSALKSDRKTRYAIERAFMAIDAALRDIPTGVLAQFGIPVRMIAGFRNILAHTYDDVLDDRVILTIRRDLPELDAALTRLLDADSPEESA